MVVMFDKPTESLKDRRIKNAEKACRESRSDWAKNFWYNGSKLGLGCITERHTSERR